MDQHANFWALPGVWIAVAGAILMLLNVVRSMSAPASFAIYLGLPLADPRDAGLLRIYGLRALFIALVLVALLAIEDRQALGLVALSAVVMPIGDAILTARAKAARGTVVRHVVIGVALLAAAVLLLR